MAYERPRPASPRRSVGKSLGVLSLSVGVPCFEHEQQGPWWLADRRSQPVPRILLQECLQWRGTDTFALGTGPQPPRPFGLLIGLVLVSCSWLMQVSLIRLL